MRLRIAASGAGTAVPIAGSTPAITKKKTIAMTDSSPGAPPDVEITPTIKSVALEPGNRPYMLLLQGPPETRSLRSGLVTLAPGESIGVHNSGVNEEMLVPLEGEGELRFADHPPIALRPGIVTYAPTHSEHDVINTGTGRLRYIFILARAE